MRLVDQTGVEVLEDAECRRLLAAGEVGRLGLVDAGQPLILPVNYVLAGDSIVLRTGAGTKLDHARGATVCFEVDRIDAATHSGWSVLAFGRLQELTEFDERDVQELRGLPVSPWAGGDRPHRLRIRITRITGRRVGAEGRW